MRAYKTPKLAKRVVGILREYQNVDLQHMCGCRLLQCTHCERLFCPECDCFSSNNTKTCCKSAMNAYYYDVDKKNQKIQKQKDLIAKKRREKTKIKIEEIGNEL